MAAQCLFLKAPEFGADRQKREKGPGRDRRPFVDVRLSRIQQAIRRKRSP